MRGRRSGSIAARIARFSAISGRMEPYWCDPAGLSAGTADESRAKRRAAKVNIIVLPLGNIRRLYPGLAARRAGQRRAGSAAICARAGHRHAGGAEPRGAGRGADRHGHAQAPPRRSGAGESTSPNIRGSTTSSTTARCVRRCSTRSTGSCGRTCSCRRSREVARGGAAKPRRRLALWRRRPSRRCVAGSSWR